MSKPVHKLAGANMDIDLTSMPEQISWRQEPCPWNDAEGTLSHRCAVKSTSICPYFCGIEPPDTLLCCYPELDITSPAASS
jgi:hypothetical protein